MKAYSYIRFSTPGQEEESLRRQVEQSEAYCQANNLTLDNTLRLLDKGLSAFHGIHRIKGVLGAFYILVEQGAIEPGSVLLVESLDRLSREQIMDALTQFLNLIRAGVKVVTLADRMEYDAESINANVGQLVMSLMIMARAHEESKMKSFRGQAAWKYKRTEANNGDKKLTARCPAWLVLSDDKKTFEVLPEVAEVINLIFQLKLAGMGSESIVRKLNNQDVWKPVTKRNPSGGWRKSYVDKILRTRATIGEYQPCKKVEGKRIAEGDIITDYFPAILDMRLFSRVQLNLDQNRKIGGHAGGKIGPVNNLFSYIAKCAYCGGPMALVCKGKAPKGYNYLTCDNARRGMGCKKLNIRYDFIEPLILSYCKGLEPSSILPGNGARESKLAVLRNQLQAIDGELLQVSQNIIHLLDNLELGEVVKDRLRDRQVQKDQLELQRELLTKEITETESLSKDTEKQLHDVKELILRMSQLEGQDRVDLRLALRGQLRRLIDQINVFPDRPQFGIRFKTGEKRLLTVLGGKVELVDIAPKAFRFRSQLWKKPYIKL